MLIKDDSFKRNCWKKGKVDQLIRGEDGQVRGAVLKVNTSGHASYIRRPVQKLIPLEVQKERVESTSTTEVQGESSVADTSSHPQQSSVREHDDAPATPTSPSAASQSDDVEIPNVSSRGRKRFQPDRYQATT